MIVYRLETLWNFGSFGNCKILKIFWKYLESLEVFFEIKEFHVYGDFQNFWNFPN